MNQLESMQRSGTADCTTCPVHNAASLKKLGIDMGQWDYVVALAGNPNTGKSTVFNALTGLRQHTGNWPGKTVSRAEGGYIYSDVRYKLVDLPGTYSLLATSLDEEIARDFILFGQPDVTVVVVDATRLERNLNLVLQILEITPQVVVCMNLMDEAARHGLVVDARRLARDLGVPIVPTVMRRREGLQNLLLNVHEVATGHARNRPPKPHRYSDDIEQAIATLSEQIQAVYPGLPNVRWVALRLLDGDNGISRAFESGQLGDLTFNGNHETAIALWPTEVSA